MYKEVKATDFLAQKSMNEEVLLVILCTGIDKNFGTNSYHDQNRFLCFYVLIRKKYLGISMTRLETLWLRSWLEASRIPHQFYWRRQFVKEWRLALGIYLPRLCGRKFKQAFGKMQGQLAASVADAWMGLDINIADIAETYVHCFNKDYQTLEGIIHATPPAIRRACRVPNFPKTTADCPAPHNKDCVITAADFNLVCGAQAFKDLVQMGGKHIIKGLIKVIDNMAVAAQVSKRSRLTVHIVLSTNITCRSLS